MPYMQRITWSGSALHQGPLPGYPASHGCVRLTESFAQLLWKTTKMGARVIVTRPEVAPLEFDHARLFVPKPKMVAAPSRGRPRLRPPACCGGRANDDVVGDQGQDRRRHKHAMPVALDVARRRRHQGGDDSSS